MWGLFFVFVVYLILHLSMLPRSNALRLQKPIQQSRGSLHLSDKRTGDQRDKSKRKNRLKKEGMDNTMEDKTDILLRRTFTTTPLKLDEPKPQRGVFEKIKDDFLAPTPAGKEPKSIQLVKTVTWIAVMLLVLVEIFVSLKTGGPPIDINRTTRPDLDTLQMMNSQ